MATKIAKLTAAVYEAVEQYNKAKDALEPRIKEALEQLALQMTQPLQDLELQLEGVLQEIRRRNAAKQASCRHAATIEWVTRGYGEFTGNFLCPDCGLEEQFTLDPDQLIEEPVPTYKLLSLPARATNGDEYHTIKHEVFDRLGITALESWRYATTRGSSLGYLWHYHSPSDDEQMEDLDEQFISGQEAPSPQQEELRNLLREKLRQVENSEALNKPFIPSSKEPGPQQEELGNLLKEKLQEIKNSCV